MVLWKYRARSVIRFQKGDVKFLSPQKRIYLQHFGFCVGSFHVMIVTHNFLGECENIEKEREKKEGEEA